MVNEVYITMQQFFHYKGLILGERRKNSAFKALLPVVSVKPSSLITRICYLWITFYLLLEFFFVLAFKSP